MFYRPLNLGSDLTLNQVRLDLYRIVEFESFEALDKREAEEAIGCSLYHLVPRYVVRIFNNRSFLL